MAYLEGDSALVEAEGSASGDQTCQDGFAERVEFVKATPTWLVGEWLLSKRSQGESERDIDSGDDAVVEGVLGYHFGHVFEGSLGARPRIDASVEEGHECRMW